MKLCPKCSTSHDKPGTFCSRKCSNSRSWSAEDKAIKSLSAKKSDKVKTANLKSRNRNGGSGNRGYCVLHINNCKYCSNFFVKHGSRQTCSIVCRDNIRSQNGTLKRRVYYLNKTFQSKWEIEIAKFLDERKISWQQPTKRIHYIMNEKTRTYLPDFFIPTLNLFLDVKNPFKQKQDAEKLLCIKEVIYLEVGDVPYIKNILDDLLGFKPRASVSKTDVIFLSP